MIVYDPLRPPDVGLIGKAQAGKDTVGSFLAPFGYERVSFADALRSFALAVDPIVFPSCGAFGARGHWRLSEIVEIHGWEVAKAEYPEVRRVLQRLGTEGVRNHFGEDAWIQLAMVRANQIVGSAVFTDVRFPNEAEAVKRRGGVLVRIVRPGSLKAPVHASETSLDDYPTDFVLDNNDTLSYLGARVEDLARKLGAYRS